MARAATRIDGLDELRKTLRDVSPAEGTRIARRTVTRIAREVRDATRNRAPVDTGNLRRSIKSKRSRGGPGEAEAEVYVDRSGGRSGSGYHWHLLEFGTRKMPAQPFTNPTIEEYRPKVPGMYRDQWFRESAKEMEKRAKKQAARQRRSR